MISQNIVIISKFIGKKNREQSTNERKNEKRNEYYFNIYTEGKCRGKNIQIFLNDCQL